MTARDSRLGVCLGSSSPVTAAAQIRLRDGIQLVRFLAGSLLDRLGECRLAADTFHDWEAYWQRATEGDFPNERRLPRELGAVLDRPGQAPKEVLFALHSAFAFFCHHAVSAALGEKRFNPAAPVIASQVRASPAHGLFADSWNLSHTAVQAVVRSLDAWWRGGQPLANESLNIFGAIYQGMFPPAVRRELGEFHTPPELAARLLEDVPGVYRREVTVCDPSCGCGVFLDQVLRQRLAKREGNLGDLLSVVVGLEVNPAAVAGAWATCCLRLASLLRETLDPVSIPVYLANNLSSPIESIPELPRLPPFDCVIGNPAWINWENLTPEFRRRIGDLMKHYGLTPEPASVGAIKLDLSALSLVVAVDRLLKPNGFLAFVITQAALKARAMSGLRRFRLPDGTPFGPVLAHDLSAVQVFLGATNRAACLIVQKGKEPAYPVETIKWLPSADGRGGRFREQRRLSVPFGEEQHAPWVALPRALLEYLAPLLGGGGGGAYRPREGVNTGGASSFFWGFIRPGGDPGTYLFRPDAEAGRIRGPDLDWQRIESELLYPLLKGSGVRRWSARPDERLLLLPHTKDTGRHALDEATLPRQFPLTHALFTLPAVERHLRSRRALRRWGGNSGAAWYSLFEVGPYTFAPYKVGYRGEVAAGFAAAVFSSVDTPILGRKLLIPDQTVHFIPLQSEEEAHYLAGILNSVFVRLLYRCYDYKHPSTFFVRSLRIPEFRGTRLHRDIARIARGLAGTGATTCLDGEMHDREEALDRIVARLFDIDARAIAACRQELSR